MIANSLESAVKHFVLTKPDVTHMPDLRRSTLLFSQGQPADSLYFIESGLVKLTRTNNKGGRIILTILGGGDVAGDEALSLNIVPTNSEAEVIHSSSIFRITREVAQNAVAEHPELSRAFLTYLLKSRGGLAEKVELLCLHDVEFRVLHYLGKLASLVGAVGGSFQIPITQLELADLIGATRETTSTVLNQLERRNLVQLSRRMLTVTSPEAIAGALHKVQEPPPPNLALSADGHASH